MDPSPGHRSRRSFPNLQHLSLAPLSSRFPIDGDDFEAEPEHSARIHVSYMQGKSAPTTPSILTSSRASSRAHSKSRAAKRRSAHGHEHYFTQELEINSIDMSMKKPKSAVGLVDSGVSSARHHTRRRTGDGATLSPMHTRHVPRKAHGNEDEWLMRAGMIMSAEARESKGQSWLASRESSTSLAVQTMSGEMLSEDEATVVTPPFSRAQSRVHSRMVSRVGSRAPSARTSRRGSMVANRSGVGFMTSMDSKAVGAVSGVEGYFDDLDDIAEPDFIDPEDESSGDEEVTRLTRQGFGFGGIIDRMVGFSLFNVNEDGEETEDDGGAELSKEEALKKRQMALKKKREELAKAAQNSAEAIKRAEADVHPANKQDEGGWQDAAWLLSVASKVLY